MRLVRYSLLLTSFCLGVAVGAVALNLLCGFHLDNAQLEIQQLKTLAADQAQQLAVLEQNLAERHKAVVTNIQVVINFTEDKPGKNYEQPELENAVKNLLNPLRGKEVAGLDPLIVKNIVDHRTVELSEHEFLLTVKAALVSEKLVIYVDAKEVKEKPALPIIKRESPPS